MKRVLFLDDETFILKVIEKKLEHTNIKCYFASSPKEAYSYIERVDFDVIIADIQMPDESGIEFFQKVREMSPRTVRIILSGYSRTASIIEAINEGHIYQYIQKPWKIDEKAIELIEEAINVSKRWRDTPEIKCSIDVMDINKFKAVKEWVLLDTTDKVIYQNSDYPLRSSYKDQPFTTVKSNIGELRLYDLEK